MKASEFQKIIKQVVKEAIQEELKDILLEAIKTPKQIVKESYVAPQHYVPTPTTTPSAIPPITMDTRKAYMDVLGETALGFTSGDVARFNPSGVDAVNGNLGAGEVGMDQIQSFLKP